MEDLPEPAGQEDTEDYDGLESSTSFAQWRKEYYERWPLPIDQSPEYIAACAAVPEETDAQRADLKEWTERCAI